MLSFIAAHWPAIGVVISAALASLKGVAWVVIAFRAPKEDLAAVARALGGNSSSDGNKSVS